MLIIVVKDLSNKIREKYYYQKIVMGGGEDFTIVLL